jgi:succinoglycan biosynthesis transport protein ExoP
MRHDMELMPIENNGLELRHNDVLDENGHTPPINPVERIRSLLRGRYWIAIGLGIVLAVIFGVIGAIEGKVQYESQAQIRVKPNVTVVMYQAADPDKEMPQMFNSYVGTQAELLQSQRVLDLAMSSDTWKQTGYGTDPDVIEEIQKDLTITHDPNSFLITVQFIGAKPVAAQEALQAILDAYKKLYAEADTDSSQKRLDVLDSVRDNLSAQYMAKKQQVMAAAQDVGTTDLDKQYDFENDELNRYDTTLKDLELQSAMASASTATTRSTGHGLDADDIAGQDRQMADMIAQRRALDQTMASLQMQGYLQDHPKVKEVRAELASLDQSIKQRVDDYNKKLASGLVAMESNASGGTENPLGHLTPDELQAQRDKVRELYNEAKKDLLVLGNKRLQIQGFKDEETDAKAKLDEVQTRIDQINVENNISGRIDIDQASEPQVFKKTRPIKFAGLGVFGGLCLGFGIVLIYGLMDRSFRSPADAKMHMQSSPMLGILPNLPDDLSDPEQAAVTAHYVHQIRTLLQIWDSGRGKQVFSVTSPVSGTGKTSLTLALGVSFAAASKTLLIDCDLVGGGLTQRTNTMVKRKIGRILQKEGLLTDRQLEEALRLANGSRRRLGEILVELGYLKDSELTQALVTQQKGNVGLIDALNGENLDDCIAETGIANLSILTLGSASAQHISRMTPQAIRKLLDQCRERFDTVLIDSGPIPGSLEASAVASEVDGVILCVSRGEQRPLAERCVQHLHALGARVAGIVFNRARSEDMVLDGTTIRASQPMSSDAGTMRQSARFGPMARAVASGAVNPDERDGNGNGKEI